MRCCRLRENNSSNIAGRLIILDNDVYKYDGERMNNSCYATTSTTNTNTTTTITTVNVDLIQTSNRVDPSSVCLQYLCIEMLINSLVITVSYPS